MRNLVKRLGDESFTLGCGGGGNSVRLARDWRSDAKRFVTSDPEFEQRTIDAERDADIVLATDGVWDVISNRDCGRLICRQPDAQTAAEVLLTEAIRPGDNHVALL